MGHRRAIKAAQALLEFLQGFRAGDQVDLAENRRDFHREVIAIRACDAREHGGHAFFRLMLAEDRFAELVEVHLHPGAATCLQVRTQTLFLAREDHGIALPAEFCGHQWHHQSGCQGGGERTQFHACPLQWREVFRDPIILDQRAEARGRTRGRGWPENLVRKGEGQRLARGITHHPRKLGRLFALCAAHVISRGVQPLGGEIDGLIRELRIIRMRLADAFQAVVE